MKTVSELRSILNFNFYPTECTSRINYFMKENIDFDVYLPSRGRNLQRDFVWTLDQKREIIYSIIIGRHIPHCAIINIVDPNNTSEMIWQIIDGKQRLSSILDFINNKFTIIIDDDEYYFNQLPHDYHITIEKSHFRYYLVNEPIDVKFTDEQKINWFKFLNFAGTPQDSEYLNNL